MVKKFVFTILIIFFSVSSFYTQTITAEAFTDKTEYQVGDYIYYTIEVPHDANLSVNQPELEKYSNEIDVIRAEAPVVEDVNGSKKIVYRFIVSKYDSGDVSIPAIPIIYHFGKDTTSFITSTNPIQILVRTLPVNTQTEIKDVKPPIVISMDVLTLILILLGLIILILIALYFYRKNQKKKKKKVLRKKVFVVPAHVKALTALNNLAEKKLWQQGFVKEYHSSITEILRRYFEERFKILALESSTTEIMQQLTRVVLQDNIYQTVKEFLDNADLVKFAKYQPLPNVNEEMMKQAVDIVENTVPLSLENQKKEKVNV